MVWPLLRCQWVAIRLGGRGSTSYGRVHGHFVAAMLTRTDMGQGPDLRNAVSFSFLSDYSTCIDRLGGGSVLKRRDRWVKVSPGVGGVTCPVRCVPLSDSLGMR